MIYLVLMLSSFSNCFLLFFPLIFAAMEVVLQRGRRYGEGQIRSGERGIDKGVRDASLGVERVD
jgi:hypothetical protein